MSYISVRPFLADGGRHNDSCKISTQESLKCPFCFKEIETQILDGILWTKVNSLQLFMKCKSCNNSFIGYANYNQGDQIYKISSLSRGNRNKRIFEKEIEELSANFVKIYGEAEIAENENLIEICGGGYRKALEFLVKDYLIKKFPPKQEEIKKKFLGNCIDEMIDNPKIKEIAKRATWLGNDESHYFRVWGDKDLTDLKKLIEITVHFITMEIQSENYMQNMN
ncbi:DUF4145 domain-containing protein [Candidatus Pacearchaeota archaeon]|nr:DUF4145 domain-containing protein [Candidatus Pacearchaeota archaeon]